MAQKTDLEASANEIEKALHDLAPEGEKARVFVFESSHGTLRAIVATDAFKGVGLAKRQNLVWEHLRKSVEADHLRVLFGVHVYDLEEFATLFPGDATGAITAFISGIQNQAS